METVIVQERGPDRRNSPRGDSDRRIAQEQRKALGAYLLNCRGKASQARIAKLADISEVQYQRIESGEFGTKPATLLRIAYALGADVKEVFKIAGLAVPAERLKTLDNGDKDSPQLQNRRETTHLYAAIGDLIRGGGLATRGDIERLEKRIIYLTQLLEGLISGNNALTNEPDPNV